jgi:hypothetical protein
VVVPVAPRERPSKTVPSYNSKRAFMDNSRDCDRLEKGLTGLSS